MNIKIVRVIIITVVIWTGIEYLYDHLYTSKDPEYDSVSLQKVKDLQDCKMVAIEVDSTKIYVIRCPNSDVTTNWAKNAKDYFVHTSETLGAL